MMTQYTSNVMISGFLGTSSLTESYKGRTITELILDWSRKGCDALKDPLLVLFGIKFFKLGLRQKDRHLL